MMQGCYMIVGGEEVNINKVVFGVVIFQCVWFVGVIVDYFVDSVMC